MLSFEPLSYRYFLHREFLRRKQKNSRYSLRAFARDIHLSPSKLSLLLRSQGGISLRKCADIATHLKLDSDEKHLFSLSVQTNHARSKAERLSAKSMLNSKLSDIGYGSIDPEVFAVIHSWYHFAILELTGVIGFRPDPQWIAKSLGLKKSTVSNAVERLFKLGLLVLDSRGKWKDVSEKISFIPKTPLQAVKEYQTQLLERSLHSVSSVPSAQRDHTSLMLRFNSDQLPEARQMIKEFRRHFDAKFAGSGNGGDSVHVLQVSLFPVTKMGKMSKK